MLLLPPSFVFLTLNSPKKDHSSEMFENKLLKFYAAD